MKKIFFAIFFLSLSIVSLAQDAGEGGKGFKKENLFTGGGINFGISSYSTVLGANPVLGYSIAKWLDAGVAFNFTYSSSRYFDAYTGQLTGDKQRQLLYGPGAFARIYPINFLFVQAQFEENFIHQHDVYADGSSYYYPTLSVPSLLVGGGYCTGREESRQPFFYLSIMFDVLARQYSPYVEATTSGSPAIVPIIRGGVQIPIFQGSASHYRSSN